MIHQKVANWLPSQDLSSSAAMLSAPEGPREQEQMFVTATLTLKKPGQGKKKKNKKYSKHAETSSGCVRTAYLETVLEHPCAATKSSYSEEAFIPSHLSTELSTELSELKASFCSSA